MLKNLADIEASHPIAKPALNLPSVALALYTDALRLDGSDPQIWLRFARAAVAAGSMAPARIALERGLEEHPGHPMLLDDLLQLLLQVCLEHASRYVKPSQSLWKAAKQESLSCFL